MRKLGVGLAFTAAVLTGCSSSAEPMPGHTSEAPSATETAPTTTTEAPSTSPQPTVPPQTTWEQEKAEFVQDFDLVKGYWQSRGVNISATQLVVIEDGQSAHVCGGDYAGDQPGGGFCHVGNTVFFTQDTLQYIGSDQMLPYTPYEVSRMLVSAAHEEGHAVQYAVGDTPTVQTYQANPRIYENQADCYAGRAVYALHPELGPIVTSIYFQYMPGSDAGQRDIYGTTAERKQEFVSGFEGGPCIAGQ